MMPDLIEALKEEHLILTDCLAKVWNAGIGTADGRGKLLAARAAMLAHLKREDDELYPVLKRAAANDRRLKDTLDIFAKEMAEVTELAISFFNEYSSHKDFGGGAGLAFAKDFGRLKAKLNHRIGREEYILYPEFEKLRQ